MGDIVFDDIIELYLKTVPKKDRNIIGIYSEYIAGIFLAIRILNHQYNSQKGIVFGFIKDLSDVFENRFPSVFDRFNPLENEVLEELINYRMYPAEKYQLYETIDILARTAVRRAGYLFSYNYQIYMMSQIDTKTLDAKQARKQLLDASRLAKRTFRSFSNQILENGLADPKKRIYYGYEFRLKDYNPLDNIGLFVPQLVILDQEIPYLALFPIIYNRYIHAPSIKFDMIKPQQ